jgi:hypothetical protein
MRRELSVATIASLVAGAACAATAPMSATRGVQAGLTPTPTTPTSEPSSTAEGANAGAAAPGSDAGAPSPAETAGASGVSGASAASGWAADAASPAPPASAEAGASTPASACNEQTPQDFLVRGNFLKERSGNERAIQYRTDQYGYVRGFGRPAPGAQPPGTQLVSVTFMGLPVKMHRRVAPALACVEQEIRSTCAEHPYTPHALAGIRYRNTYRGGEVTNHAYGIAIDVDPDRNTCCGCVPPWNDAPACKRKGKSEYDHMDMPECWVHAFERFGFYWLGHDVLKDTMHFEFLGDPDKIVKAQP